MPKDRLNSPPSSSRRREGGNRYLNLSARKQAQFENRRVTDYQRNADTYHWPTQKTDCFESQLSWFSALRSTIEC
jgi:hypothetical protein